MVVDIDAYNEVLRKLADLCIKQDLPAVNRTHVLNLLANFHSFHNVVKEGSNGTKLGDILGMGSRKVENMKRVFTEPFIYNKEYGRTELN